MWRNYIKIIDWNGVYIKEEKIKKIGYGRVYDLDIGGILCLYKYEIKKIGEVIIFIKFVVYLWSFCKRGISCLFII